MLARFYSILIVVAVLCSCEKRTERLAPLYDIDSLLTVQADLLSKMKTSTQKKARMNGEVTITTLQLIDPASWQAELDIFGEVHLINKSINRKAYQIKDGVPDDKSNLVIKSISTAEDLPIKYVKIYYQDSIRNIKRLEAHLQESNSLYSSSKFLTLAFESINDKTVLTYLSVKGGQKMFLSDSVQYSIESSVTMIE